MSGVESLHKDGERRRARCVSSAPFGVNSVLVLVWPDLALGRGDHGFLLGIIALQVASLGWALGSAYSKRHARNDHILATTALQMLVGGAMMLSFGTVTGEWQRLAFNRCPASRRCTRTGNACVPGP